MPFSICFLLFLYYSLFSHLFVLIGNPIWQGIVQVQSILFISLPLHMDQAARRDDIAACFTERTHLGFDAHFLEAGSRWANARDHCRQFITEQCPPRMAVRTGICVVLHSGRQVILYHLAPYFPQVICLFVPAAAFQRAEQVKMNATEACGTSGFPTTASSICFPSAGSTIPVRTANTWQCTEYSSMPGPS